jgi:DNA topoisomerase VI subunit B
MKAKSSAKGKKASAERSQAKQFELPHPTQKKKPAKPAKGKGPPPKKGQPISLPEPVVEAEAPAEVEAAPKRRGASAEQMASKQREISISEFFTKNRHLLGFDNPSKALLTTVKEAVDNSLDACEEAGILPDILVQVEELGGDRFKVTVQDNGPGIVKAQIPKIFGKLLYGSKFHRLKQARGQQGIGISAAAMYGQLTTGKPIHVISRIGKNKPAHDFEIQIDTRKNQPIVLKDSEMAEWHLEHGTRVSVELVADYLRGQRFLTRYVEQTALANPHARIEYRRPKAETAVFPRSTEEPPKESVEIRPHPHGVELGALMLMAKETQCRDVRSFLQQEFSRVSGKVADEILAAGGFKEWNKAMLRQVGEDRTVAEQLHKAIVATKIMAPPTNCLSPIGEELIHKGLKTFLTLTQEGVHGAGDELELLLEEAPAAAQKPVEAPPVAVEGAVPAAAEKKEDATKKGAIKAKKGAVAAKNAKAAPAPAPQPAPTNGATSAETAAPPQTPPAEGEEVIKGHKFFITSVTRPPKVYRGNPFQIEVGLAYGGALPLEEPIELYRFANRVPLLFQRSACAATKAVIQTDWRNYKLSQPKGSLPVGPMILFVHIASVWVPFTSESKEAIADYPEIIREVQLGLQECGRKLVTFIRKREHAEYELKRRSIFELYIQEIAHSMKTLTGANPDRVKKEFLALADKFTKAEQLKDEALEKAAAKQVANPRKASAPEDSDEEEPKAKAKKTMTKAKPVKAKPAKEKRARATA